MVERTARRQFVSQTRTRAIGINTQQGDDRLALLDGLSKFAQASSVEVDRQQRAAIETQQALGASRAAQDLVTVEKNRRGITDEDTLAAKLSYNAIVGQHETMEAGNKFVEWYQSNPSASDDEIQTKKSEIYQPVFEKYGDDPRSLKQISLQVQESQFKMVPVQEKIKSEYTYQKNNEALTMSIGDMLADPNADMDIVVNSEIPARAKALGLPEFDYKKSLMNEMVNRASNGDDRLLNKLKGEAWSKNSVLIEKATTEHQNFINRESAIAIGDELGSIELENSSLSVPWETTLRKLDSLNNKFPNSVSAAKVASMKQARDRAKLTTNNNSDMLGIVYSGIKDSNVLPLALNGGYSKEDKDGFIKWLDSGLAKKTQDMIASGVPEADANAAVMKERLDLSRTSRLKFPNLDQNLKGLIGLNPDDYPESSDLPAYARDGLAMIAKMDAATIDIYLTSREDKVFANNIKSSLRNREPYSAFKRAYNVKQNPFKLSSETVTDLRSYSEERVSELLESGTLTELLTGVSSVPPWQVAQLTSRVNEEAMLNAYNGMLDPEDNSKQAASTVLQDFEQTFNGTMVNVNKKAVAKKIGIPETDFDANLASFADKSLPYINSEVGSEVDLEDISFDFSGNGTFTMRYKGGEQVGGAFLIDVINQGASRSDIKSISEKAAANKARRYKETDEEAEEARHMIIWAEQMNNLRR